MNKTIALVIAASVIMMTGVTVMFMGSSTLGEVNQNTQNLENQKCDLQAESFSEENSGNIDPECIDYIDEGSESQGVALADAAGVPYE